jgi:exodeoxyribonuclease V alpha subunit
MTPDPSQAAAVEMALRNLLSIITGGPGTGKTFSILTLYRELVVSDSIALAAPTGKAAARMTEATGFPATTIHRLLEYSPFFGGFKRNAENPINADTVIIDEASMIDIYLARALFEAIRPGCRVVLVGDKNQLPSVGPGQVFGDLIASEKIPVSELTRIHRQAAGSESLICRNAERINRGEWIDTLPAEDFVFIVREAVEAVRETILKVCDRLHSRGYQKDEIQVLAPQKKTIIGTDALNDYLAPFFNPKPGKISGSRFPEGSRVIQLRNNYEIDIFNGETGIVRDGDSEELLIDFGGGRVVYYPMSRSDDLKLAYALTIHKSQGSEFPAVVMPVHESNYMMLARSLLYTGITRGKRKVVLVGSEKAMKTAIRNVSNNRYTRLKDLI